MAPKTEREQRNEAKKKFTKEITSEDGVQLSFLCVRGWHTIYIVS